MREVVAEIDALLTKLRAELEYPLPDDARQQLRGLKRQLSHAKKMIIDDPVEKVRRLEAAVFQILSDANLPVDSQAHAQQLAERMHNVAKGISELKQSLSKAKNAPPSLINNLEDLQENLVDVQYRYSLKGFEAHHGIADNAAELLRQRAVEEAKEAHSVLEDQMFGL